MLTLPSVSRRAPAAFALAALSIGIAATPLRPALAQDAAAGKTGGIATQRHVFVYRADTPQKSVAVAGTFNHWDRTASPMVGSDDGKTWRLTLPLPPGEHQYKFVLNGETWVADPAARTADDGNGNRNSVLLLLPPDYARPASPRDGVTAKSALLHPNAVPYLNYDQGKLTVSLRARPNDLQSVALRIGGRRLPMSVTTTDTLYARYTAEVPWDRKRDLAYTFELIDGPKKLGYGANGLGEPGKTRPFVRSARAFPTFTVPSWVERTVFYQIFPDRFANGDSKNDPPDVQPWNAAPTFGNRFGGDVAGVRAHLPYLTDLGISAVYFNPVFRAPSNHRYDTEDYKTLDGQFGTNAEFAALTREMQTKGIRTVMDFVFNHTATTFFPFADIRRMGAESRYRNWYFIKSYPVRVANPPNYVGWAGYAAMPKLNLANPATHDYMLNLVNYWKKEVPLAGLRLDVANEVDMAFWRDLRRRVKGLDPNMWIVGEQWGDGSPWLTGDQWDSKMNYEFLWPCRDFFADGKITATEYLNRLMQVQRRYAPQVSRNMMNLLSSHDTPRFLTLCKNDEDLHRLAATVQFTWVGAPSVYYGEEIGIQGGADPANRAGMQWDRATPDNAMLRYYKRLIRLRQSHRALQSGEPTVLLTDNAAQSFAYARTFGSDVAVVAVNRSGETRTLTIPLPQTTAFGAALKTGFVDGLTGQRAAPGPSRSVRITLPPLRAAVLIPAKG